ncbi:MAG: response regulator [Nitratireductor sp.]|nr:response regulator [Nitratireductor sp.]MCC0019948.1 response regulator [Nitratireductor sp.]
MLRILTVDDSRTMRTLIKHYLSDAGYEVVEAEHGAEGLEKLAELPPDAIITDINMPVMDGFEFIDNVRALKGHSRVPILVLSTESDDEKKQRARNSGATGWIVKPFDPVGLIKVIERVLPRQQRENTAAAS